MLPLRTGHRAPIPTRTRLLWAGEIYRGLHLPFPERPGDPGAFGFSEINNAIGTFEEDVDARFHHKRAVLLPHRSTSHRLRGGNGGHTAQASTDPRERRGLLCRGPCPHDTRREVREPHGLFPATTHGDPYSPPCELLARLLSRARDGGGVQNPHFVQRRTILGFRQGCGCSTSSFPSLARPLRETRSRLGDTGFGKRLAELDERLKDRTLLGRNEMFCFLFRELVLAQPDLMEGEDPFIQVQQFIRSVSEPLFTSRKDLMIAAEILSRETRPHHRGVFRATPRARHQRPPVSGAGGTAGERAGARAPGPPPLVLTGRPQTKKPPQGASHSVRCVDSF